MKITSGVNGLDPLIGGGFESGTVNLISGKVGSGKSIFCLQFIWEGLDKGEKCMIFTTQDSKDSILLQAERFGWDFDEKEKDGLLTFIEMEPYSVSELPETISKQPGMGKIERVIIDSAGTFERFVHEPYKTRKSLYRAFKQLREMGKTVLVVSDIPEDSDTLSETGFLEYMSDSVILLNYTGSRNHGRSLKVRKLRFSDHSDDIHSFEIGPRGLEISHL
jgi:circadian clock protein KaiC